MRRSLRILSVLVAIAVAAYLLLGPPPAHRIAGITVEDAVASDPDDKPLAVKIWSPAGAKAGLPLIVISHGTGGSLTGHADTAEALAQAGFVVAAMNHTGDSYRDDSYVGRGQHLVGRSRHVARVIDHMLQRWPGHDRIDPGRVGMLGHSAGGFTALVVAGAEPDMTRGAAHCREKQDAWDCNYLKSHGLDLTKAQSRTNQKWLHDPRIKSAVIAAPAVGHSFEPDRLTGITIPIQLWEAKTDAIVDDSPAIIRDLLPAAPESHIVAGAGHFSFLTPCGWGMNAAITLMHLFGTPDICGDPAGFDRAAFHRTFNASVIDFFKRTLPPSAH